MPSRIHKYGFPPIIKIKTISIKEITKKLP